MSETRFTRADEATSPAQNSAIQVREGVLAVPGELKLHFGGRLESVSIAWRLAGPANAPVVVALGGISASRRVWLPDEPFPVVLPRTSEGLYLLQRVRDEAHRFAITFHRQRRSKRMTASVLDNVPGLGEARRKALLRHFGSLKRLAAATPEEIAEVPGIGRRTAETLLAALNPPKTAPEEGREADDGMVEDGA